MGHHHDHGHHGHDHGDLEPTLDAGVPDEALEPSQVGRRGFLRSAGLLGVGAAGVVGGSGAVRLPSAAATTGGASTPAPPKKGYLWLAGDHHTHTQYSPDAQYRVADHVQHAAAYGLGWMVVTDHGTDQHAKIGVEKVNPDILRSRERFGDRTLVFQGLEWNIPAAEHGTVFVHPGPNEVDVLKRFENGYDGVVNGAGDNTATNEALAITGLDFLADELDRGSVADALMLANHPARKGIDSPHEIRGWRDAQPRIAIGMEGAPGHQAAGIPEPYGPGSGRGYYDNAPDPVASFPGYPMESYRTYGGFDWMTSTVGGLWDSLLSEGKPWWITANSDSHKVYLDSAVRGGPDTDFDAQGFYADPVHVTAFDATFGDFWPGYYSRTHVGAAGYSYAAVMDALRAGRVWVDHGALLESLDVRVRAGDQETTLGGVIVAPKGTKVSLSATLVPAQLPNFGQFVPQLAKVDLIRGVVTGPASDRDTFSAPGTKVTKTWDVSRQANAPQMLLTYDLGVVGEQGFYVRGRGSDGKRSGPGLNGAGVDPNGPVVDVVGDADPWQDLWFYTNPIWVLPA